MCNIKWFGPVGLDFMAWKLFNPESHLYKYIKDIWFSLVRFYSILTIVGYLIPNPIYTYILNIYDLVCLGFIAYQPV